VYGGVTGMTDGIAMVDVSNLKQEIAGYMATGYAADEILCKDILRCIDRHTVEVSKR